ncbi:MAG: hypothetical protein KAU22_11160 [Desulfuromonadales bacterium]|nr:hypothetical protein [Desulfuromonadales bacterium]
MHHKLQDHDLDAIRQLSRSINNIDAEILPEKLSVTAAANQEIQILVASCNKLMTRRANDLRRARQFAADVTHELRTPLTILRGETELALRSGRNVEQLREVLESNLEEISRMTYLIEDLLLLSKSDLGEIPLKAEPLPLNDLIEELHHQAQLLATDKNIEVKLLCPQQQILLHADNLRLRQVFLNLLTNAIKYTSEDGTVVIELTPHADTVAIAISDTGIGMEEKHLRMIFDRFYRVNKTNNRYDGGTGLGLAIVKWIVHAHQGTINVTSTLGQGSTFSVILPRIVD